MNGNFPFGARRYPLRSSLNGNPANFSSNIAFVTNGLPSGNPKYGPNV